MNGGESGDWVCFLLADELREDLAAALNDLIALLEIPGAVFSESEASS